MKIKLKDLLPNPYRNFKINPLDEVRIEKLVESISATSLWKNVSVRKNKDGKYEIVFGHHRVRAAILAHVVEAEFSVEDLTDTQMLERMSRDNDPAYDSTFLSVIETAYAAVQGLAEGTQEDFKLPKKTNEQYKMYAPSFVPGKASVADSATHPYTALALGQRLGYTKMKGQEVNLALSTALDILMLDELGYLDGFSAFKRMSANQAADFIKDKLRKLKEEELVKADEALKAKADEAKADEEARRKKLKDEAEAKALEALNKKEELAKAEREARRKENEKLAEELAEKRKKTEEADNLRVLKNQAAEARRILKRFGSDSVTEGAAIELAVKEAEGILESKDAKAAIKAAEKLSKISSKTTDAYFKQQEAERIKSEAERKGLPTRRAVKTMLSKLEVFPSEGYALRKELEALSRNGQLEVNERELVRQALLSASDWFNKQAVLFLPPIKVDVLAESAAKARKAPPAFEAEDAAKKKAIQDALDKAAQERQAERDQENSELETKAKVSKSKAKTKKEKK